MEKPNTDSVIPSNRSRSSVGQSSGFLSLQRQPTPGEIPQISPDSSREKPEQTYARDGGGVLLQPKRRFFGRKPKSLPYVVRQCGHCSSDFTITHLRRGRPDRGRYCSPECYHAARIGKPFKNPKLLQIPGTREQKTKAAYLIGRLIKSGELVRPKHCSRCGGAGLIDAHHPDYKRPYLIVFLCHPCHIKSHCDAVMFAEIALLAHDVGDRALARYRSRSLRNLEHAIAAGRRT